MIQLLIPLILFAYICYAAGGVAVMIRRSLQ